MVSGSCPLERTALIFYDIFWMFKHLTAQPHPTAHPSLRGKKPHTYPDYLSEELPPPPPFFFIDSRNSSFVLNFLILSIRNSIPSTVFIPERNLRRTHTLLSSASGSKKLFTSSTRKEQIKCWECTSIRKLTTHMHFHITGTFKLFINNFIHTGTSLYECGSYNR